MPACGGERWRSPLDTYDGSFYPKHEVPSMASGTKGMIFLGNFANLKSVIL